MHWSMFDACSLHLKRHVLEMRYFFGLNFLVGQLLINSHTWNTKLPETLCSFDILYIWSVYEKLNFISTQLQKKLNFISVLKKYGKFFVQGCLRFYLNFRLIKIMEVPLHLFPRRSSTTDKRWSPHKALVCAIQFLGRLNRGVWTIR